MFTNSPPYITITIIVFCLLTCGNALAAPQLPQDFCQEFIKHIPSADVAYQEGIDVHGNPVTPADLEKAPVLLPNELSIPLTVDLIHFLGGNKTTFPFNAMPRNDMILGTLTIKENKVYLNGIQLENKQQNDLATLCIKANKK